MGGQHPPYSTTARSATPAQPGTACAWKTAGEDTTGARLRARAHRESDSGVRWNTEALLHEGLVRFRGKRGDDASVRRKRRE